MNRTPALEDLPQSPPGKSGWPWTTAAARAPRRSGAWPRITVVTPSFNQADYIEETLRSVILQGYPNLEYIVLDGGSTDSSAQVIAKYAPWLSYWSSEKDRGQTHAISKGIDRATGELFNWINSDDLLAPGTLFEVAAAMEDSDCFAGVVLDFDDRGRQDLTVNRGLTPARLMTGKSVYHQPGVWLRTDAVRACGSLDEAFHYTFDWDLMIRYLAKFPRVAHTSKVLAHFRFHNESKTVRLESTFHLERRAVLKKLLGSPDFRAIHGDCDRALRRYAWMDYLAELRGDSSLSPSRRAKLIARAAVADPRVRLSRMTLGAIRQNLVRALAS